MRHPNDNDSQPVIQKPPPLPKNETIPKVALTPELASSDETNSDNSVQFSEQEWIQKGVVPEVKNSSPNNTLIDSEEEILASKTKIPSSMALDDAVFPRFHE